MSNVPVDAVARQHAVDSKHSVLVQAPAGSGKTTLLAQRYLRLLANVDAPERILALTFTRRAAQEMRERVMKALQSPTSELGVAAQRRMRDLGLDLLRHPSRLRIETIDAFNAWLAGQLPITAGAGSRLNLTDNAKPLYEEAARRALAHDLTDPFGQAVDRVLELDDQRWVSLVRLISEMLPTRDGWLPLLAGHLHAATPLDERQLKQVRRHLNEDLHLLVSRSLHTAYEVVGLEKLESLCRLVHAAAKRIEDPPPTLSAWAADGCVLTADAEHIERWRGIADMVLTKQNEFRKQVTRNEGFPPKSPDKAPMLDLITELGRDPAALRVLVEIRSLPDPRYDDAQWGRVREVAQVLVLAAAELDQVFRERGAVDFPTVSMAAVRALGSADAPTDLSLRLDYRLQHILVDEFQDTSSAQLELVKLLTSGWQHRDGRSIFCVGDPMQSIYGFRQAEVRAFLELAEEGIGEVQFDVERLRSNFRSDETLVEWINSCFSRILPRIDDRERGAIAFRPSEAARRPTSDDGVMADAGVSLRGFATRLEEANAIAELIAAELARHPEWRVVVLVRARSHAREIASSLRARAIQFRAVDIEPLQDRPVVRDLVMLIGGLLHWGDRTAWLALLRAPWVGLTLADLLRVARARPVIWEALLDDAVLSALSPDGRERCRRLRGTLEAAFRNRHSSSVARWVEQTWLALGGPACFPSPDDLGHVATVLARLRELEEQGLPDPADLVQRFSDLYAEHRGEASVEIMTIHKSKGLEFDLVVVPALDKHIPGNRSQLLLSHEFARTGRSGLVMAARPGVGSEADRLFDYLRHQSRDAANLEAERLLYVACTRAKWQLCLTAMIGTKSEPDGAAGDDGAHEASAARREWKPRAGSLLGVLWPVCRDGFALSAPEGLTGQAAESATALAPRGGPLHRVPSAWSPPEYVGLAVPEASMQAARTETPVFDWAGETARRVGSLVHAELQVMDLDVSDAASIKDRQDHYRAWLALHGVPDERLQDASARVMAALIAVQGDERGRWILQKGYRDDFREHALSGLWQGEVLRVVFDRSFIDQDGVRWVIDYKTSQHGGGNLDEFLEREVERYRPQLDRYAHFARKLGPEPVRVGLYFPLMRAWRDWEP